MAAILSAAQVGSHIGSGFIVSSVEKTSLTYATTITLLLHQANVTILLWHGDDVIIT